MANKITLGLEVVVLILAIVIMVLAYQNFEKSDCGTKTWISTSWIGGDMSENRKKFTWRHVFLLWLLCAEVLTVAILLIQRDDLDWSLEKADMMYKKVSEKYDPYNEFSPARNEEGQ